MRRHRFTSIGFAFSLFGLSGCVPPPAPPLAVVAAPPPVAVIPAAPPVALVPSPPHYVERHHAARAAHLVARHHYARHYAIRQTTYVPAGCGSTVHPCNVEHVTAPIQ